MAYSPVPKLTNGNATFNNDVNVSGILTAGSGVVLVDLVPASTTNALYNEGGTLKFNGSAIGGGGGSSLTAGSGIVVDGDNRINIHGGTGNLQELQITSDNTFLPNVVFTGSGVTDTPVTLEVRSSFQSATGSGTALLFQGTQGQLFSITDNLSSGTIFNVSDITGLPMLEVTASGDVEIGEFADNITIHQPVRISGGVPADTTDKLYNDAGTLKFNGSSIGGVDAYTSGIATYASGQAIENEADILAASGYFENEILELVGVSGIEVSSVGSTVYLDNGYVSGIAAYASGQVYDDTYVSGIASYASGQAIQNDTDITYLSGIIPGSQTAGSGLTLVSDEYNIYGGTGNFQQIDLTSDNYFVPNMLFTGSGVNDTPIRLKVLSNQPTPSTSGTALSFEGTEGQLFGITDNLSSGTIFSVNDITGLPLISVDASGDVKLAEFGRDIIAHKPITLQSGVPSVTTNKLYNDGYGLYFNGSAVGGGGGGGTVQGTDATYDIQPADEGATAGNTRGESSVDLQTQRSAATQVASGGCSTISGGENNTASANYSTVVGGKNNTASGWSSTVGGCGNTASGARSTIGGGSNSTASGYISTMAGGHANTASGDCSTVGGGASNTASATRSTVSGGISNTASATEATVGGGTGSTASGTWSTVGGGYQNNSSNSSATIGGGSLNIASGNASTVGGGGRNTASGYRSTAGGGYYSCASGSYSTVSGGLSNTAAGTNSAVTGGKGNYTNARHSIVSGHSNVIVSPTNECCSRGATISGGIGHNSSGGTIDATTGDVSGTITCCNAGCFITIGGGCRNISTGIGSTVGGGFSNCSSANQTVVAGGGTNRATGNWASILGGSNSQASSSFATIGGGYGQTASGAYSTIGGGNANTSSGNTSFVGGGRSNTASGACSTVGGGYSNTASGACSTVGGGRGNKATGSYSVVAGGGYAGTTYENCAVSSASVVSGGTGNCVSVAGACNSTVSGGFLNKIETCFSNIGGGCCNTICATGFNAINTIAGGGRNYVGSYGGTVSGGELNCVTGAFTFGNTIGGGTWNNASASHATVTGGCYNTASGGHSTVGGGRINTASGSYSTVTGGQQGKATRHGETSHAAGQFAAAGDAQHTVLVARKSTTDATANQVMFLDNSSARLTIPAETTWMFTIKLAAHNDTNNDGGWWYFRGGIARDGAGNTSLIGSVTSEYSVDSNISTATAEVVADDTNDALEIRVTGVAAKDIRWVAVADISQVSWGTP